MLSVTCLPLPVFSSGSARCFKCRLRSAVLSVRRNPLPSGLKGTKQRRPDPVVRIRTFQAGPVEPGVCTAGGGKEATRDSQARKAEQLTAPDAWTVNRRALLSRHYLGRSRGESDDSLVPLISSV